MFMNTNHTKDIDYTKCLLCQGKWGNGYIVNPLKSRNCTPRQTYENTVQLLTKNDRYCNLPFYLSSFLKRENAAIILEQNKVKWHKACKLKYGKKSKVSQQSDFQTANLLSVIPTSASGTICLFPFCVKGNAEAKLHTLSKSSTYDKIKKCALNLQENELLRKLGTSISDVETVTYHLSCITSLYNRSRLHDKQVLRSSSDWNVANDAFSELYIYIEKSIINDDKSIFRLADLKDYFTAIMNRFGILTIDQDAPLANLNKSILKTFPSLQEFKTKEGTFFANSTAIPNAIAYQWLHLHNYEVVMSEAGTAARKDILAMEPRNDNDLLHQEKSISKKLKKLVTNILEGSKEAENSNTNQAVLTVCQIIQHNIRMRPGRTGMKKRHGVKYETPLTRYLALLVHSFTRKKAIVNKISKLGLCVNYDRVLEINTNVGNAIVDLYTRDKVVCPPHLPKGHFVTTAVDNVDHNLSSTGAKSSFHGTSISINVHLDDNDVLSETVKLPVFAKSKDKKMKQLPTEYTLVEPYQILDSTKITVPTFNATHQKDSEVIKDAMKTEHEWLSKIEMIVKESNFDEMENNISWSSFFGHRVKDQSVVVDQTGLLPLLQDHVNNPATIRHVMKIAMKHTHFLNPGQRPVLIVDQPLFAISKEIQWSDPQEFGEDKITIMFGGLHIEKTFMACIGNWLKGSEWEIAISDANIFTSGTAQSCLNATHITNTRMAHQITAAVLHIMKRREFTKTSLPESDFQEWEKEQEKNNPQFLFWNTTLKLELILLNFVKSIRERNFKLYCSSLLEMIPWFFALGHYNYARWIAVHIRDMQNLHALNPDIWKNFNNGKFVFRKTHKCFSAMAIDQCHEQHNATVKGDSGVIGLTNNLLALARWIVAGPEIMRLVKEFEIQYGLHGECNNLHHDMNPAQQRHFLQHVKDLLEVFENNGNPFMTDPDLVSLISKYKFDEESINDVRNAEEIGLHNYEEFVTSRFIKKTKRVSDPIKMIDLKLMRLKAVKKSKFASKKLKSLKIDRDLFMRLFVQAQHRPIDLDDFCSHENQPFPPSLSDNGYLIYTRATDTLECLLKLYDQSLRPMNCSAMVIEAESAIHFIKPSPKTKSFNDYFNIHFEPYLTREKQKYERVELVFCEHSKNHLLNVQLDERRSCRQQRVVGDACLPSNWLAFIRDSVNKDYLFSFLAEKIGNIQPQSKLLGNFIDQNDTSNTNGFYHEDTRFQVFAHVRDLVKQGHQKIIIRTIDAVVVVLSISIFHLLDIEELWMEFGLSHQFRYIPVHQINSSLGSQRAACLPFFEAFANFNGYSKKTAFGVLMQNDDFIDITLDLLSIKDISDIEELPIQIEKCVSFLYDTKRTHETVNATRKFLLTVKYRCLEKLPPTKKCLFQHFKRAMYQGVLIWGKMLNKTNTFPPPLNWGWKQTTDVPSQIEPLWSDCDLIKDITKTFIKCGCKKKCSGRCKCKKANYKCTLLCDCQGECYSEIDKIN